MMRPPTPPSHQVDETGNYGNVRMTHNQAAGSMAAERYLLEEMTAGEREEFEAHFFECADCGDAVRTGALMRAAARAGLAQSTTPATVHSWPPVTGREASRSRRLWKPSTALPWAAAALLALAVGYQSLIVVPSLERRLGPQALSPVTLRPPSRGSDPVVLLPAAGSAVTLAVDITARETSELAYELRTEDGQPVASGRVAVPPPGTPLLLLLPAWTLSPSERYILSVRAGAAGSPADEYRFTTQSRP
jgi:hypothetical protein